MADLNGALNAVYDSETQSLRLQMDPDLPVSPDQHMDINGLFHYATQTGRLRVMLV